jgi:HAD superfamily hydrolase (TIGR01509 family)
MTSYKAVIFDLNGTMINDMHYHEVAWHDVFVNQLKAPLTFEQVRLQLYGRADEIFHRIFGPGKFSKDEIDAITNNKEETYRTEFLPHLKLINGLDAFLDKLRSNGIPLAIGTAAPRLNVDFVLDNLKLRHYFHAVIGPNDVNVSKPHPEVFLKAANRLGFPADSCVVFEDSPKGIEAAARAGMKAIGVTSYHSSEELKNENLLFTIEDYTDKMLGHFLQAQFPNMV